MRSMIFTLISCSLFLGIASCDKDSMIPKVEDCIILSDKCYCYDGRLPEGERKYYPSHNCVGYRATNPSDYSLMETTILDLEVQLLKCERER